jgi:hypothetical protein
MATRPNPYSNFNFTVKLGDAGGEDQVAGGFSDVSGLGNEVKFADYRNGNDKENHTRKIANVNSTDDVTLKRGVIGDLQLFAWLTEITLAQREWDGPFMARSYRSPRADDPKESYSLTSLECKSIVVQPGLLLLEAGH